MTVYVRPGVEVDKKRSNEKRVTLRNLQHKTTGRYRCEVSTEGPTFATESKYGDLLVVGKIDDTLFEKPAKSLIFKVYEQSLLRLLTIEPQFPKNPEVQKGKKIYLIGGIRVQL